MSHDGSSLEEHYHKPWFWQQFPLLFVEYTTSTAGSNQSPFLTETYSIGRESQISDENYRNETLKISDGTRCS